MAVAEIIGAAVGVMLLVVVAYMLVGSVLTSAEIVSTAQKDLTLQNEERVRTSFVITDKNKNANVLNISITNTGSEIIGDKTHMDIFTSQIGGSTGYWHLTYHTLCGVEGTWCIPGDKGIVPDTIHPNQLDPDEKMWIMATSPTGTTPGWCQVVTSNGASDSAYI